MRHHLPIILTCLLTTVLSPPSPTLAQENAATRKLTQQNEQFKEQIMQVADNVHVAVGYSVANVSMIVGEDGVIIIDTGMMPEAAEKIAKKFRELTDKPVVAIIYTHSHGDHTGGAAMFLGTNRPQIWGHKNFGSESGPWKAGGLTYQNVRGARQAGFKLPPEQRINNGVAPARYPKRGGEVFSSNEGTNPTHFLDVERKTINVAGVELELTSSPGETNDGISVWYPAGKVLFAGDTFYRSFPNLYAIRGTPQRQTRLWARSLAKMADRKADALVGGHTVPVVGADEVSRVLRDYRDAVQFVHDKTVEGINKGLTPDELVEYVQLPERLANSEYLQPFYGHPDWGVRQTFNNYLGWFDGNPSNLFPLPPKAEAERMVKLAGGKDKLLAAAKEALKSDDNQWTAQLADQLLAIDKNDTDAKLVKADALTKLARTMVNATARNYYLTVARELREQVSKAEAEKDARSRPRQETPTIASIGDAVMEKIDLALPDELYQGYLFWHQADELATDVVNYAMLLDAEGKVVHRWDTDLTGGGHTSYLLDSGGLLRTGRRDRSYLTGQPVAATDTLQITDTTGKAIWELSAKDVRFNGNKITFHHDMLPMPNGNILVLIYEEISPKEAAAAGWSAGKQKTVWSDGVLEIKPDLENGSHEVVWYWRFIDHMIQDQNSNAANYGAIADHPEKIDAHFPKSYAPMNAVRQHLNALDYHAGMDQILISSFIYNEIWVIDHSTTIEQAAGSAGGRGGKGGDLLFRYGNPAAYARGTEKDRLFQNQHDANWVDEGLPGAGNILVFNNNTGTRSIARVGAGGAAAAAAQQQLEGMSNVHEIRPTLANGRYVMGKAGAFEAKQIWFWEHKDFFAPFQGGARRLPNGNTLLTDTVGRRVWEVASDGDVVVRYDGPAPAFKTFKYSAEQVANLLD
ncbi:beta-lactamase domain-containing protein [Rhodopirellula maiorica SM1]|uniref:Beta-lactamase domain-containing protein n=1 Tax=Rhodopirellula maiorica SM1 TaxID=1265738 RepID=M5RUV3_9BACT|nr:alkyl sulfatase dimerization domain-containing protein [Rhodopirellula maiorica]EMI22971.1 beta-lactamase domain-containing protein [Rhodopirellula maiorica SM1]